MQTKLLQRIIFIPGLLVFVWMDTLFCTENLHNRDIAIKQHYENGQWIDESKCVFEYDLSNKPKEIEYLKWQNGHWENNTTITYTYNTNGQLTERLEKLINTDEVISHEIYTYNEENRLFQITFPDIPWFHGKGLFGGRVSDEIIQFDPFLLVSHIKNINFKYDNSGNIKMVSYGVLSDAIPDSVEFFSNDFGLKTHPMNIVVTSANSYESVINTFKDSLKTFQIDDLPKNRAYMTGVYSYISNGNQLSVIYDHPSYYQHDRLHRLTHFYEISYPNDMRTIWIYSANADSIFMSQPKIGHINPQQEILPFKDMLSFWIYKYFEEDQQSLPIQYFGRYDFIDTAHYSSKLEKSLSLSNTYIPGNYYDYFYEPRFQSCYPLQDREVIKTIEQYRLNLTKINSPLYYGIGWEYREEWINYIERNYEYNDSDRLQRNVIKIWKWDKANNIDPKSGQWENDSQYAFQYDESGNCDQINCSIWDTKYNAWNPLFRILYTYSDASNSESQQKPTPIQLSNYPNPFNTTTHVQFLVPEPAEVSMKVYDITGKWIRTILSKQPLTGQRHTIEWNGKNSEGKTVPSGMYLLQLELEDQQIVKKCLYVK